MLQYDEPGTPARTAPSLTPANTARRGALAKLAGLCGIALSGAALDALAADPAPLAGARPGVLDADELALTGVLADLVIPQTGTPGALAAGAHRTIDHLLAVAALPAERQRFKDGLARLDAVARAESGKRLVELPQARQVALLRALDAGRAPFDAADGTFFQEFKRRTVFAYYTSEAGATRELAYLPVPGGYKGRIKLTPATRAWAL